MPVNSFENYPMTWKPELNKTSGPKYIALASMLEHDIEKGKLKPGVKLPPQRELADFLDINLSTISRAFKLCEQKGLICASVGNGTFISSDVGEDKMLLQNTERDHVIEMGAIVPDEERNLMVKKKLQEMLLQDDAISFFSYGKPEPDSSQKKAAIEWMGYTGMYTDEEHILQAAGGQNALLASVGALFHQGDRIGTDPVTYPGMKNVANFLGIQLIPIQTQNGEMTEEGIRYAVMNEKIKGIYCIPDFHNPTAHVMTLDTRKMIAKIAQELNLYIIEDGINSMLMKKKIPPIASFAKENVIYLASLSKTIAAGLRTSYLHVPLAIKTKILTALYTMNISISPLQANLAKELITSGIALQIIKERMIEIEIRNKIMNEILQNPCSAENMTCPFRWLPIPDIFNGKTFEICAKEKGVQLYGAERFLVGNSQPQKAVRIAITSPETREEFQRGMEQIATLLQQNEENELIG